MKNVFLLSVLVSALVLTAFTFSSSSSNDQKVIVIDIGHGGHDNGAQTENILEKDINLKIVEKIKQLHTSEGVKILYTRDDDEFISLEDRVKFVEKNHADMFISIHSNMGREHQKGIELYYSKKNNSSILAKHFKDHLSKTHEVRKVTSAGFKVLNEVSCPAIMIETGFLSNDEDRQRLTSEERQTDLAKAILDGLNE